MFSWINHNLEMQWKFDNFDAIEMHLLYNCGVHLISNENIIIENGIES